MSKFSAILAKRATKDAVSDVQKPESPTIQQSKLSDIQIAESPKRLGRPPAKRSDPEFQQVTAYIRKGTYAAVRTSLFIEEERKEFSELVEDLLAKWLRERADASKPSQ